IDLLLSRLKGKADPSRSFWTELSTAVGIVFFIVNGGVKFCSFFVKKLRKVTLSNEGLIYSFY
ncbi:MAG: hypothetical protein B7X69_06820, partial [Sulfurovum sp. 39-42-12]